MFVFTFGRLKGFRLFLFLESGVRLHYYIKKETNFESSSPTLGSVKNGQLWYRTLVGKKTVLFGIQK